MTEIWQENVWKGIDGDFWNRVIEKRSQGWGEGKESQGRRSRGQGGEEERRKREVKGGEGKRIGDGKRRTQWKMKTGTGRKEIGGQERGEENGKRKRGSKGKWRRGNQKARDRRGQRTRKER